MRLLCFGNREWRCRATIRAYLERFPPETVVIAGGAPGADDIAESVARELGFGVLRFDADWNPGGVYDPEAGKKRNQRQLDEGRPDRAVGFGQLYRPSRRRKGVLERTGTLDMLERLNLAGVDVELVAAPYPEPVEKLGPLFARGGE